MRKLLVLGVVATLALSGCTSETGKEIQNTTALVNTTELVQETKVVKEIDKKSKYADYNFVFDYSIIRKEDIPNFLEGNLKDLYCKAYMIERTSRTDNSLLFTYDGDLEHAFENTIERDGVTYYRTGFSYESFYDFLSSYFTREKVEEILSRSGTHKYIINVDGEVCVIFGEGGTEAVYKGVDFKQISRTEDQVKFNYTAHYAYDYLTKEEFEERFKETDLQYEHDEESVIELINTDKGWRVGAFDMWT